MIFLIIDSNYKNTHFYRYIKEVTRFFCTHTCNKNTNTLPTADNDSWTAIRNKHSLSIHLRSYVLLFMGNLAV